MNAQQIAGKAKYFTEITIAALSFLIIIAHTLEVPLNFGGEVTLGLFEKTHPLKVAGFALALAASLDLLYMLFSPSIHEGLEALLLGFISAILMTISEENVVGWEIALTVAVFTGCMLMIYWFSEKFRSR